MPFIFDQRAKNQQQLQGTGGRGRLGQFRGMGADALSMRKPQEPGKLKLTRGVAEAAKVLKPDPKKPETCKLPIRITGHEKYKSLGPEYEQMLTLVFIRTMDLFRAFGIDFQLILGGATQNGDVVIDATNMSQQGPAENLPPQGGPTRLPPTLQNPTREPPTTSGPTREPPTRPGPELPNREPGPTRPPNQNNPTRPGPELPERTEIQPEIERNWPTVAASETARVWGDPHFVGADGGKFDVQGEAGKTYNLLSDTGLKFFGQFDGWGNGITVVGRTGLTVTGAGGESRVHFCAKSDSMKVDGEVLQDGQSRVLADGGTVTKKGRDIITRTGEGYRIVQHDKGKHIDAEVHSGDRGVHNGRMPTGLMGCTFDADKDKRDGKKGKGAQGEGAIDGVVGDHEVKDGVFGTAKSALAQGDIDGDGKITLDDARMAMEHAMGRRTLNAGQIKAADIDGDGVLSMADALFVLRMAQQAGGVTMAKRGNGKPIRMPKDGTLQLELVEYGAQFKSYAEAHQPLFKYLFHGAQLQGQQGATDTLGVKKGDYLDLGMRAQALGQNQLYDLSSDGRTFWVEEKGNGGWRIGWNGPNALSQGNFEAAVFDVNLLEKSQAG